MTITLTTPTEWKCNEKIIDILGEVIEIATATRRGDGKMRRASGGSS
jgi:hypothetical protein